MTNIFNPEEFIQKLNNGNFKNSLILKGIVERKDKSSLLFSENGNKESWMSIPAKYIENIEFIENIKHGDKSYASVKLFMKVPDEKSEEASLYAILLASRNHKDECSCGHSSISNARTSSPNRNNATGKVCFDWPVIVCTEVPDTENAGYKRECHVEVGKFCW